MHAEEALPILPVVAAEVLAAEVLAAVVGLAVGLEAPEGLGDLIRKERYFKFEKGDNRYLTLTSSCSNSDGKSNLPDVFVRTTGIQINTYIFRPYEFAPKPTRH
jgi:hypothetical protein